jgi:hypothetical protein
MDVFTDSLDRRVLYRQLNPRQLEGYMVVETQNFVFPEHFMTAMAKVPDHLNPSSVKRYMSIVNHAAYYTGKKPAQEMCDPDMSAAGVLTQEPLLDHVNTVVGYRLMLHAKKPLSSEFIDSFGKAASPAYKKTAADKEKSDKAEMKRLAVEQKLAAAQEKKRLAAEERKKANAKKKGKKKGKKDDATKRKRTPPDRYIPDEASGGRMEDDEDDDEEEHPEPSGENETSDDAHPESVDAMDISKDEEGAGIADDNVQEEREDSILPSKPRPQQQQHQPPMLYAPVITDETQLFADMFATSIQPESTTAPVAPSTMLGDDLRIADAMTSTTHPAPDRVEEEEDKDDEIEEGPDKLSEVPPSTLNVSSAVMFEPWAADEQDGEVEPGSTSGKKRHRTSDKATSKRQPKRKKQRQVEEDESEGEDESEENSADLDAMDLDSDHMRGARIHLNPIVRSRRQNVAREDILSVVWRAHHFEATHIIAKLNKPSSKRKGIPASAAKRWEFLTLFSSWQGLFKLVADDYYRPLVYAPSFIPDWRNMGDFYDGAGHAQNEYFELMGRLFTVQDGFSVSVESLDPAYVSSVLYYPIGSLPGDAESILSRPGAPSPMSWPLADSVVVVESDYLYPEFMVSREFPYAIGSTIKANSVASKSYVRNIDEWTKTHVDVILDAMNERHAFAYNQTAHTQRRAAEEFQKSVVTELQDEEGGLALAKEIVDTFAAQDRAAANEHLGLARTTLDKFRADAKLQTEFVYPFVRASQAKMASLVSGSRALGYQGLLTPIPSTRTQSETEKRLGDVTILPTLWPGDNDGSEYRVVTGAGLAERIRTVFPDLSPFYDAEFNADPNSPEGKERADESSRLFALACKLSHMAGDFNLASTIHRGCDLIKLSVIHQALRNQAKLAQSPIPAKAAAQQADEIDRFGQETIDTFYKTQVTAPAMKEVRESILSFKDCPSYEDVLIETQPVVNDSVFTAFVTWYSSTITLMYSVSSKTRKSVMVTTLGMLDQWTLPIFTEGKPGMSFALTGPSETGKSFTLWIQTQVRLPGSTVNCGHITTQAFALDAYNSYRHYQQHEAPQSQFMDSHDAGNGHRVTKDADNAKNTMIKTLMTECIICSQVLVTDENGNRKSVMFVGVAHNTFTFCLNWRWMDASSATRSRVTAMELTRPTRHDQTEDPRNQFRPSHIGSDLMFLKMRRAHHLLNAMYILVKVCENTRVWPYGVLSDQGELIAGLILKTLTDNNRLPSENFAGRRTNTVCKMAKICAINSVCFELLATHKGHAWLRERNISPFSWIAIRDFIAPRLSITIEHVVYALTLLDFVFDDYLFSEVLTATADLMKIGKPDVIPRPLKIPVSEFVGNIDLLSAMSVRRAPPPASSGESAPPMATTAQANQTAEVGVYETTSPDPVPGDSGIDDYRYASLPYDLYTLAGKLVPILEQTIGCDVRPEYIRDLLGKMAKQYIESPYYHLNPTTGQLDIARKLDGTNEIPHEQILCILERDIPGTTTSVNSATKGAPRKQICIAYEFFSQRLLLPIIKDYHEPIILEKFHVSSMEKEDQKQFKQQLAMPPSRRLILDEYTAEEILAPDSALLRRIANVDIFAHPTAAAIQNVLSNSAIGRLSKDGKGDDDNTERRFITAYSPKNFRLSVQVKSPDTAPTDTTKVKRTEVVALNTFHQPLIIRRSKNLNMPLLYKNPTRLGRTTEVQVTPFAGRDEVSLNTLAYLRTRQFKQDLDPDLVTAQHRFITLGSTRDAFLEARAKDLGMNLVHTCAFQPYADRLAVDFEREALESIGETPLSSLAVYPLDDIRAVVTETQQDIINKADGYAHAEPVGISLYLIGQDFVSHYVAVHGPLPTTSTTTHDPEPVMRILQGPLPVVDHDAMDLDEPAGQYGDGGVC